MLNQKNNIFLIVILFIISATLVFAYIVQYVLGHQPCKLCIYQRIPYFLSIFLIFNIILFTKYKKVTLLLLAMIFAASMCLSFYHFGIEQGFFSELTSCTTNNLSDSLSKEQLMDQLSQKNVSCSDVSFKILGLSLASINSIFSFILSVIFLRLFLNYGKY